MQPAVRAAAPHSTECSRELCKPDSVLSTLEHVAAFLQFCFSSSDVTFKDIARILKGEKFQLFSLTAKSLLFRMKHSEAEKTLFAWCRRIQQASTEDEIWTSIRAPISFNSSAPESPPSSKNWPLPRAESIQTVDTDTAANTIVFSYSPSYPSTSRVLLGLRYSATYDIVTSPALPLRAFESAKSYWKDRVLAAFDLVAYAHMWNCFRIQSLRTMFDAEVFGHAINSVIRSLHLPIRVISVHLSSENAKNPATGPFFTPPGFERENDTLEDWTAKELPPVIGYRKHQAHSASSEPPKKRQRFPEDGK